MKFTPAAISTLGNKASTLPNAVEGMRTAKYYRPDNQSGWALQSRYVYGAYGEILAQYAVSGTACSTNTPGTAYFLRNDYFRLHP